ncbi:MAG: LacI family transcriptional regulator [Acidobacteria bacterium]|nr:MAG: LacI family transcriptional regulator [Acidobacteriota bacterium]PYR75801.1 MAG: LacI family transcriptional regulator [Acidobacteriota bacterium]
MRKTDSKPSARDPYLVKSVVHSSQLLSAFRSSGEALPLREIASRSELPKSMTFRLLYTLERCGMIEKIGENLYRSHLRPFKQRPYRFGYAAQGTDYQFSKEVSTGLQRAAAAQGIELICVDNRYNAKIAQRNADVLVREKVDLVIEFQTDEHVAPIVAAKYRAAGIPLIAIEIPHPGATYFGANNYEAGLIGGRHLGRWAKLQRCDGEHDEVVLITLDRAGTLPRMRLTGMLVGMKEVFPALENCHVTYLDGDGKLGDSFEAVRRHLRTSRARRLLIGAINDPSALGALRAMQEAGRAEGCAIMGQNASPEGREELRQPGTRLIGSVAYFPERYGAEILAVALDILHRRTVPPAVFVKHQLVTPENVDHIYPNDQLMQTFA